MKIQWLGLAGCWPKVAECPSESACLGVGGLMSITFICCSFSPVFQWISDTIVEDFNG